MLYELRSYDIDPPLMDGYIDWANNKALPVLVGQFGMRLVGFWHMVPPQDSSLEVAPPATNIHWIICWKDEQEMISTWKAATSSPEWAKATQGMPKYHLKIERTLLQAIPRSPFQ